MKNGGAFSVVPFSWKVGEREIDWKREKNHDPKIKMVEKRKMKWKKAAERRGAMDDNNNNPRRQVMIHDISNGWNDAKDETNKQHSRGGWNSEIFIKYDVWVCMCVCCACV